MEMITKILCFLFFLMSASEISADTPNDYRFAPGSGVHFDFFTITLSEDSAGQEEYEICGRKWTHNDLEALLVKMSKSEKDLTVFIYTGSKKGEINTKRLFTVLELLKNAGWEGIAIFELNQKDGDKSKNMQVTVSLKDIKIDIRDPIISCPGDFFTSQTSPADYAADFITKMPPGFEIVKVPTPDAGGYPQEIRHKATGIEMVYVAPGEFMMGSPHSEEGRGDMESPHKVKLTRGYYIGKYEVTQSQWEKVMGNNPSKSSVANQPFVEVSWDDCKLFCNKLGGWFRLPTEAEWEYAARGGNKSKGFIYSGSNNLDEVGWYSQNSGDKPHEVGQKKPNELGIFDMSGNVFEWCFDWYANYPFGDITDPSGPSSAELSRVSRGGCWSFVAKNCRSATRIPGFKSELCGFRVMLEIPLVGEAGHSPAND